MKRSDFFRKESRYTNDPAELERKYQRLLKEQEQQQIYEALNRQAMAAAAQGLAGGGGNFSTANPLGSGTIVFNGLDPTTIGSYVAATNTDIHTWLLGAETTGFTVEWFQYFQPDPPNTGAYPRVFSVGPNTTPLIGVSLEVNDVYVWPGPATSGSWAAPHEGRWAHVAIVWDPIVGDISLYLDGVREGNSAKATWDLDNSGGEDFYIGSDGIQTFTGYAGNITNFRWVNDVLQMTDLLTYPVPTTPLTAVPGTKLLLLGGSVANPVFDASGTQTLTYLNVNWSPDTPFI